MKTIEKKAKTVQLAIDELKSEHNLSDDQFSYEIIQQPSSSFLGMFGGKEAVVRFTVFDVEDSIKNYLKTFFQLVNLEVDSIDIKKEESGFDVTIVNPSEPGFLIGKDGNFLNDLEYLLNLAVLKNQENRSSIKLDVDGYRQRRSDGLVREVKIALSRVLKTKMSVKLKPMTSSERRVVHQMVLDDKRFKTATVGDGKKRQVIISLTRGRSVSASSERIYKKPVKTPLPEE